MRNEPSFDAPIPGQSLTGEQGSKPWEQPAKYNTVEEALSFYVPKFNEEEALGELINQIESGTPLTTLADITTKLGSMQGLHTIDVALQIAPVLVEYFIGVAEAAGVEYKTGIEKKKRSEGTSSSDMGVLLKDFDMPMEEEVFDMPMEEEETKGIMTRRDK
jgi:hypothetical protein